MAVAGLWPAADPPLTLAPSVAEHVEMRVRFIDQHDQEWAVATLSDVPRPGDKVTVCRAGGKEDRGTVIRCQWFVPSNGDPPQQPLNWDVEVVLTF